MQLELYAYFFLGSFSLGYALLRIGFPKKQQAPTMEKVLYGFMLGLMVFGVGLIGTVFNDITGFIIAAMLAFLLIGGVMLTRRRIRKETDLAEFTVEKVTAPIPDKALTKEERAARTVPAQSKVVEQEELVVKTKEQPFKEKNSTVIDELRKGNPPQTPPLQKEREVPTVEKKSEESETDKQKSALLKTLRETAVIIGKKEDKKEEDEEELEDISEEVEKSTEEEEY